MTERYQWQSNKEIGLAALKYKPIYLSAPKILEALKRDFPDHPSLPSTKSIASYVKRPESKISIRSSKKKSPKSKTSSKQSSTPLGKSDTDRNAGMYSYFIS